MQQATTPVVKAHQDLPPGDIRRLGDSFLLALEAAGKAPTTIRVYMKALELFTQFLRARGMTTEATAISREHVGHFMSHALARIKVTSASIRYRALQQFWRWAEEEGEVERSPMERMTPPRVPEDPPPVFREDQLAALLWACEGTTFEERRDRAVLRMLLDTGIRRAELAGLRLRDVDLRMKVATVTRKAPSSR